MIPPLTAQKPFIKINARELAITYNEIARQNRDFALGLMAEGFRADISAEDIMHATENLKNFDDAGKLTKIGKQNFKNTIQTLFRLDSKQAQKLTIGDYVTMLIKSLEDFKSKAKKV